MINTKRSWIRIVIPAILAAACIVQGQEEYIEEVGKIDTDTVPKLPHHRINLEYGFCFLRDETPDDAPQYAKDYNEKLASGNSITISYCNYFRYGIGMGFLFSRYSAEASLDDMMLIDTAGYQPETLSGTYSEKVSIYFVGILITGRMALPAYRLEFTADARLGFMPYFNEGKFAGMTMELSCPTAGFGGSLGVDYMVTKAFGLGCSFNGYLGSIRQLYIKGGEAIDLDEPISLNRFDINVGLKIHFDALLPWYRGPVYIPSYVNPGH